MVDPTAQEIDAMLHASPAGGDYLEKLGKTDMALFSEDEWMGLIESIVTAFQESMAASYAPMALVRSVDDPFAPITAADCPF